MNTLQTLHVNIMIYMQLLKVIRFFNQHASTLKTSYLLIQDPNMSYYYYAFMGYRVKLTKANNKKKEWKFYHHILKLNKLHSHVSHNSLQLIEFLNVDLTSW
jgi:hypothetical protein